MALSLSSPAFADGGPIPRAHGYKEGNSSPPLRLSGAPEGCASLALVMDDPDAVAAVGRVWTHWLAWDIAPADADVPAGAAPAGCAEGRNDFGDAGYGGPAPPDREHTYVFTLYALGRRLGLPAGSGRAALEAAMEGSVLGTAGLTGTYAP